MRDLLKWKANKIDASGKRNLYEVGEFSIKHGHSILESRRILRESGQARAEADAAALRESSST